jgi:hypothetical protein
MNLPKALQAPQSPLTSWHPQPTWVPQFLQTAAILIKVYLIIIS